MVLIWARKKYFLEIVALCQLSSSTKSLIWQTRMLTLYVFWEKVRFVKNGRNCGSKRFSYFFSCMDTLVQNRFLWCIGGVGSWLVSQFCRFCDFYLFCVFFVCLWENWRTSELHPPQFSNVLDIVRRKKCGKYKNY